MSFDIAQSLKTLLDQLHEERDKLKSQLASIEKAISDMEGTYSELTAGEIAPVVDKSKKMPVRVGGKIRINPSKEKVAKIVRQMLEDSEKPLSRSEIYKSLDRQGIKIWGKDPEMVLSTMLWRAGPELGIENRKGVGYVLQGKDYKVIL
ncbi:hypothetical protein [Rhizobium sp. BK379]|uniref:hypothetical protein n=1 Tax=Rhizobium sp. BK379 TaxID=2587059 RepID=UPI00161A2EA7|nr:hypothetical protein [Rhizobium sp. BK379]MBB3445885.1 chaperonin cofactor prefoldin [Rhizobium sp. BK379]